MSPDGRRRSREHWTDTMEAGPADPPAHVHRLPKVVRLALVGLTVAVFLALVGIGLMAGAVYQASQYVQGRGEYRDREAARMEQESEESIRRAMCDLLDQLPEGGLLDRPRIKYGCGPGIPVSELSPDERAQLSHRAPRVTTEPDPEPAESTAKAPFSGGAVGPPARSTEPPAPPRPTLTPAAPTSSPTSASSSTASRSTDLLCDVLTSVLEEIPCPSAS